MTTNPVKCWMVAGWWKTIFVHNLHLWKPSICFEGLLASVAEPRMSLTTVPTLHWYGGDNYKSMHSGLLAKTERWERYLYKHLKIKHPENCGFGLEQSTLRAILFKQEIVEEKEIFWVLNSDSRVSMCFTFKLAFKVWMDSRKRVGERLIVFIGMPLEFRTSSFFWSVKAEKEKQFRIKHQQFWKKINSRVKMNEHPRHRAYSDGRWKIWHNANATVMKRNIRKHFEYTRWNKCSTSRKNKLEIVQPPQEGDLVIKNMLLVTGYGIICPTGFESNSKKDPALGKIGHI